MKDFYLILKIEADASEQEIKSSFRKLAVQYHPDTNQGNQAMNARFQEIREAYETLSDPDLRSNYNSWLLQSSSRYIQVEEETTSSPKQQTPPVGKKTGSEKPESTNRQKPQGKDLGASLTYFLILLWLILPVLMMGFASLIFEDPTIWMAAGILSIFLAIWITIEIRSRF